jgi:hypothetical protein
VIFFGAGIAAAFPNGVGLGRKVYPRPLVGIVQASAHRTAAVSRPLRVRCSRPRCVLRVATFFNITCCELHVSYCGLDVAFCELYVAYCGLRVVRCMSAAATRSGSHAAIVNTLEYPVSTCECPEPDTNTTVFHSSSATLRRPQGTPSKHPWEYSEYPCADSKYPM